MADLTKRIIFIVLHWISQMQLISAKKPYCEWGVCSPDQFCCRSNECCEIPRHNDLLYAIFWIVTVVMVGLISYCTNKYKNYFCRKLANDSEEKPIMA